MYFVVLSYPRSGSTVVQRIINTSSNSICIGEKPMTINYLHSFVESLLDAQTTIPQALFPDIPIDDDRNPVFMSHAVDIDAVFNYIKAVYVRHILNVVDAPNIGWKENFISSYPDANVAESEVRFIRRLFPDILFILNVRDPLKCAESALWKRNPSAIDELNNRRSWIVDSFSNGLFGPDAILLDHDIWSEDKNHLVDQLLAAGIAIDREKADLVLGERLTHISDI